MKDKILQLLKQNKNELTVFSFLCINFLLFFTKETYMSDGIYPMHLVDTAIGFKSRTLIGSISGLLWEHPTKSNIFFLQLSVTVLTFFLVAVFLGGCIKKADEKTGKLLLYISIIVAVLPYGFRSYINLFELLDIYWVLSAVLCLLSAKGKRTLYLIPVFIITGLWVHYAFLLAFMPLIYILCFNACYREGSKRTYALTLVMIITSVSFSLYFLLTMRKFDVISFEEFTEYIIEKAGDKITAFESYVGSSFRPTTPDMFEYYAERYDAPENIFDIPPFFTYAYFYLKSAIGDTSLAGIICDIILASPLVAFFIAVWKTAMKKTSDKQEKLLYFLCLITPIVHAVSLFTSSDTSRWLSIAVISNLFLLAVFIKDRSAAVGDALIDIISKTQKHKKILLPVLIFYLSIIFIW